jgi:hypothetical protein
MYEFIDLTGDEPVLTMEPTQKRAKVSPEKEASPTRSALKRSPSPKKNVNVTFHESTKKHKLTLEEIRIIEGEKVSLEQVRDCTTEKNLLRDLYVDAAKEGISAICGETREEALALAKSKNDAKEFELPIYFRNYRISDLPYRFTIGRLAFSRFIYGSDTLEGLLKVDAHLKSENRGKGLLVDALTLILDGLVKPMIGNKFFFKPLEFQKQPEGLDANGMVKTTFRGIYAQYSLTTSSTLNHSILIATYYKAGFGLKLVNDTLIMSYPPTCYPPGPPLSENDVKTLIKLGRILTQGQVIKKANQDAQMVPGSSPVETTMHLSEMKEHPQIYSLLLPRIKAEYLNLLKTTEIYTFVSALNTLMTFFEVPKAELDALIPSDKASGVLLFIEKEKDPPQGIELLKLFVKAK